MLDAEDIGPDVDRRVDEIVAEGPRGAVALAGVATFIVFALWVAFYLFVFTPRATP